MTVITSDVGESKSVFENIERQWIQVQPKSSATGDNFVQGAIDFEYSVGGRSAHRPSMSYVRVELELTEGAGGTARPAIANNLAFADNPCAGLFSNASHQAGDANISSITSNVPQASQVRNRLSRDRGWLNSVGKSAYGMSADFFNRVNMVSSDGLTGEEDTIVGAPVYLSIGGANATVEVKTDALTTVVGVNTEWKTNDEYKVAVNDLITINGLERKVASVDSDTQLTITADAVITAATNNAYIQRVASSGTYSEQANRVYFHYQPPLGIFGHDGLIGAGSYRLQLTPNNDYKRACVQALSNLVPGTNYDIVVRSIQFFPCIEKANIPITGVERLFLTEQKVQAKPIDESNSLTFTVPPSTQSIAVFVQGREGGKDTRIPATLFKTVNNTDTKLTQLQLTYANTTKPPTRWISQRTAGINLMTQRYYDTQIASQRTFMDGGCETYNEWQKRGGLYLFDFQRDSSDRSTNLQVDITFSEIQDGSRIFVCSNYTRVVEITTNNGYITDVKSLDV